MTDHSQVSIRNVLNDFKAKAVALKAKVAIRDQEPISDSQPNIQPGTFFPGTQPQPISGESEAQKAEMAIHDLAATVKNYLQRHVPSATDTIPDPKAAFKPVDRVEVRKATKLADAVIAACDKATSGLAA